VGDFVEADGEAVTRVLPRINSLARPAVANIGQAVIVVASEPEPDFYLVDKMLINCRGMDIDAVLCLNKIDLRPKKLYNTLVEQFGRDAEIIKASVVGKRIKVETKDKKVRTLYFVTFELEKGDRPEFQLEAEQYAKHAEGDRGELWLRKGRMVSFARVGTCCRKVNYGEGSKPSSE